MIGMCILSVYLKIKYLLNSDVWNYIPFNVGNVSSVAYSKYFFSGNIG